MTDAGFLAIIGSMGNDLPYVPPPPEGEMVDHIHHMHGMDAQVADLHLSPKNQARWHHHEHKRVSMTHQHDQPRGIPGEEQWPDAFQLSEHTDFYGGTRGDWDRVPGHTVPLSPLPPAESSLQAPGDDLVDLYHHTYPESADAIRREKLFVPASEEDRVYFTNMPSGGSGASDFGHGGVVHLRMPRHLVNDWGADPHGEHYYDVDPGDIRPEHFVQDAPVRREASSPVTHEDLDARLQEWFSPQQLGASTYPHPKTGYGIQTGLEHYVARPPEGQAEGPAEFRVTDYGPPGASMMHRFQHPVPNKPIEHVYRGVSSDEWRQARERGYLRSDQRGTIADWEGTNAATDPRSAVSYLPSGGTGHVLKIRVKPEDKWFTIHPDQYIRTRERIPLDRVEAVSPQITKGTSGAVTTIGGPMHREASAGGDVPAAERTESVRHMLDNYRPYDFDTWDEVRDNNIWDHPKVRAFVDDVRRRGVLRPIPVDYEQDPPQVRNGHTRLLAAERAGIETVPTRQHQGWADPDDDLDDDADGYFHIPPDERTAALKDPAPGQAGPSADYKETRQATPGGDLLGHFEAAQEQDNRDIFATPTGDSPVAAHFLSRLEEGDRDSRSGRLFEHPHLTAPDHGPYYVTRDPQREQGRDYNERERNATYHVVDREGRSTHPNGEAYSGRHSMFSGWSGAMGDWYRLTTRREPDEVRREHPEQVDAVGLSEAYREHLRRNPPQFPHSRTSAYDDELAARPAARAHEPSGYSPSEEWHGPYEVVRHPQTGRYHVVDNAGRHAMTGNPRGFGEQQQAEASRDYIDRKRQSQEAGKALAEGLFSRVQDIMDPGGTEESRQSDRVLNSAQGLMTRYEGGRGQVKFDSDEDGGQPYYELEHRLPSGKPSGWRARDYGGPYIHLHHEATGDEAHDVIGAPTNNRDGARLPGYGPADLERDLNTWHDEEGGSRQHYEGEVPRIRQWKRRRQASLQPPRGSAPGSELLGHFEAGAEDYGVDHRPNDESARLHDLTENGTFPADVYDHPEWYDFGEGQYGNAHLRAIRKARGNPDARVRIWRAAPALNPESRNGKRGQFNTGDWVALNKKYAEQTAAEVNDPPSGSLPANHPDRYHIWSAMVRAGDVRSGNGDELQEWGYWGEPREAIHVHEDCSHRMRVRPREAAAVEASRDDAPGSRKADRKFFHGTSGTHSFRPGDLLTPEGGRMQHVYYTSHLPSAAKYATWGQPPFEPGHPEYGRGYLDLNAEARPGHVYEVIPETKNGKRIGRHAEDPWSGLPGNEEAYRTKGRLRVLHEVDQKTGEPIGEARTAASLPRGAEFRDEWRGSHGGHVSWSGSRVPHQQYGTWHAHDAATGEHLGRLDYSVTEPGDPDREAYVQHVQADEGHAGKGVASALMDHFYAQHPEPAVVRHSLRTDEGAGWWDRYIASRPHVAEREERQRQQEEQPAAAGPWYHASDEDLEEGDQLPGQARLGQEGDLLVHGDPYSASAHGARTYEVVPDGDPAPGEEGHRVQSLTVRRRVGDEEVRSHDPYSRREGRSRAVTAARSDYPNPHTGGHEWFHGSPWKFRDFGADQPMSMLEFEDDPEDSSHWNTLIGHHFAACHQVAEGFAKGDHASVIPYEEGSAHNVVHARLAMRNPKVYRSEHDMDQEAYEREWKAGNHIEGHLDPELQEYHDEGTDVGVAYDYAGDGERMRSQDEPSEPYMRQHRQVHPYATGWLNAHPGKYDIARRHVEHLKAQGHDGIVYGNEFEKSPHDGLSPDKTGNIAAIPFGDAQVDVTQRHSGEECLPDQDAVRSFPGRHQPALFSDRELEGHEATASRQEEPPPARRTAALNHQLKLFHVQPDPTLHAPESGRHNPEDPRAHTRWRSENDPDYEPDSCEHCGADLNLPEEHADKHHEWLTSQDWYTDWDHEGPGDTLHRGIGMDLPDEVHQVVHDESRPVHERAHALLQHVLRDQPGGNGLGNFWSDHSGVAKVYAESAAQRYGRRNLQTPVMLHVRTPAMEHIETDPEQLQHWGVFSYHLAGNREVPVSHGAPLRVTGISWAPPGHHVDAGTRDEPPRLEDDPAWTHHETGGEGIRATASGSLSSDHSAEQHAALELVAHFGEAIPVNPDDPASYRDPPALTVADRERLRHITNRQADALDPTSDEHEHVFGFRQDRPHEKHRADIASATMGRDDWHQRLAATGHVMAWEPEHHGDVGYAPGWHGTCRNCGGCMTVNARSTSASCLGRNARNEPCAGPGTAWQNELIKDRRREQFGQAVSQFGQDVKDNLDRQWLREQGLDDGRTAALEAAASADDGASHEDMTDAQMRAHMRGQHGFSDSPEDPEWLVRQTHEDEHADAPPGHAHPDLEAESDLDLPLGDKDWLGSIGIEGSAHQPVVARFEDDEEDDWAGEEDYPRSYTAVSPERDEDDFVWQRRRDDETGDVERDPDSPPKCLNCSGHQLAEVHHWPEEGHVPEVEARLARERARDERWDRGEYDPGKYCGVQCEMSHAEDRARGIGVHHTFAEGEPEAEDIRPAHGELPQVNSPYEEPAGRSPGNYEVRDPSAQLRCHYCRRPLTSLGGTLGARQPAGPAALEATAVNQEGAEQPVIPASRLPRLNVPEHRVPNASDKFFDELMGGEPVPQEARRGRDDDYQVTLHQRLRDKQERNRQRAEEGDANAPHGGTFHLHSDATPEDVAAAAGEISRALDSGNAEEREIEHGLPEQLSGGKAFTTHHLPDVEGFLRDRWHLSSFPYAAPAQPGELRPSKKWVRKTWKAKVAPLACEHEKCPPWECRRMPREAALEEPAASRHQAELSDEEVQQGLALPGSDRERAREEGQELARRLLAPLHEEAGGEDTYRLRRQNDSAMDLRRTYPGGHGGHHGFDEDGDPYYDLPHRDARGRETGWYARHYGPGPEVHIRHQATGDDLHDVMDVGTGPQGQDLPAGFGEHHLQAVLDEWHGGGEGSRQYLEQNDPHIRRWRRRHLGSARAISGDDEGLAPPWQGQRLFHGTRSALEPGEVLTPQEALRHPAHPSEISEGHVHVTTRGSEAAYWAEHADPYATHCRMTELGRERHPSHERGENQGHAYPPRVYQVEAAGPVEPDPHGEGMSYRVPGPVRVIREVRPLQCAGGEECGGEGEHWPDHQHYDFLEAEQAEDDDDGMNREAALDPASPAVPSFTWKYQTYGPTGYVDAQQVVTGPFYHGSRSKKLREGDEVTTGRKTNPWGDEGPRSQYAHFTTDYAGAAQYAAQAGGHVYEVEPTGEVHGGYSGGEFKSRHPLRVVRRAVPPLPPAEASRQQVVLLDVHDAVAPATSEAWSPRTPAEAAEGCRAVLAAIRDGLLSVASRLEDAPVSRLAIEGLRDMAARCADAAPEGSWEEGSGPKALPGQ